MMNARVLMAFGTTALLWFGCGTTAAPGQPVTPVPVSPDSYESDHGFGSDIGTDEFGPGGDVGADDLSPRSDAANAGGCEGADVSITDECCDLLGCEDAQRECVVTAEGVTCGECFPEFEEREGACVEPPPDCETIDCSSQARVCIVDDSGASMCGDCVDGYLPDSIGFCRPVGSCANTVDCGPSITGPWSTCVYSDECAEAGTRERTVTAWDCRDTCQAAEESIEVDSVGCTRSMDLSVCSTGVCNAEVCVPPPTAPGWLFAADGTSTEGVQLSWAAVAVATEYVLFRDGVLFATVSATDLFDSEAAPTPALPAPAEVTASRSIPNHVDVSWRVPSPVDGPIHTYSVRARNVAGMSARDAVDDGHRGAGAITAIELRRSDADEWVDLGIVSSWRDEAALGAQLIAGTASAGLAVSKLVVPLHLTGTSANEAPTVTYAVRALSTVGISAAASASGHRSVGAIAVQWERSANETGPFEALPGATSIAFDDTSAPATGAFRYYRARVSADGADEVVANVTTGSRMTPPAPDGSVFIPSAGQTTTMGSPLEEFGRSVYEPLRTARLTYNYFIQTHEVTQEEWRHEFGNSPSYASSCGPTCPVERVNWFEAVRYANARSAREDLDPCYQLFECSGVIGGGCSATTQVCEGYTCARVEFLGLHCEGYRLPTEVEWEFAARAGTTTATYVGDLDPAARLCEILDSQIEHAVRYCGNSGGSPGPVGGLLPNAFGLYDVLGNVWEWTHDRFTGTPPSTAPQDYSGPSTGADRAIRGGSWREEPRHVRGAVRFGSPNGTLRSNHFGIRLARTLPAD